MIQKQKSSLRPSTSLNKVNCLPIDKTFPHLIANLEANNTPQSKQKKINGTIRQFDKKFYEDQIRLLLGKMQVMAQKNKVQQAEIQKLKQDRRRSDSIQHRTVRKTIGQVQCPETNSTSKQKEESGPTSMMVRLKKNYVVQVEKLKLEYENKLKDKANAMKIMQYDNYCKITNLRFEEERLKTQNEQLKKELSQVKKKLQQKQRGIVNEDKVQGLFQVQSYKQENALLRSFIYKIQLTQQKLQKLQQSRKKERQQFVQYAEQSQSQKRQLLKDMEQMKNVYQQKIKLLNLNYQQKLSAKDEQIKQLQYQIQIANSHVNHIPSSLSHKNQDQKLSDADRKDYLSNSQKSHNQWQKVQKSLFRLAQQKDIKLETMCRQIQQLKEKEVLYFQQIQRLRVERNNIALQNQSLSNQLLTIQIQTTNIQRQNKLIQNQNQPKIEMKQDQKNRLSQFLSRQSVSHIRESNIKRNDQNILLREQQAKKLEYLQKAFKQQRQACQNARKQLSMIQSYMKSKQNSMRLTQQMSQNSYKELWQKYSQLLNQNQKLRQINEKLQKEVKRLSLNLQSKQKLISQFKVEINKQKEIINSQCQILRQKYKSLQFQFDQIIQQTNQRAEQAEITIFKQSKQIQRNLYEINNLNQKINKRDQQITKMKTLHDEGLRLLREQLDFVYERQKVQEGNLIAQVNGLNSRCETAQALCSQLKINIETLKLQQLQMLQQKQHIIKTLQEQLQKKHQNQAQKVSFKKINTLFDSSFHQSRVSSNPDLIGTAQHYQHQICQINASHQSQVNYLKQYIRELIAENDQLRQRCISSVNKWKQMFEGVISYNQFVGHQQQIIQKSNRKRDFISGSLETFKHKTSNIEQKLVQKYQIDSIIQESGLFFGDKNQNESIVPKIDLQAPSNTWEVYSVPDFSERKIQQPETFIKNAQIRCNLNRNLCSQMQKTSVQNQTQNILEMVRRYDQENDPNADNSNFSSLKSRKYTDQQEQNKNNEQSQPSNIRRKSAYDRFKETR